MSIHEVSAEQLARLFHHYYEALAPDFTGARPTQMESWPEVPTQERRHMTAAVRLALLDLDSKAERPSGERERYFAKPGDAEWGS